MRTWRFLEARWRSCWFAQLRLQAADRIGRTPDTEKGALAIGALFQHLAASVELAPELLGRPGKKEFCFDQILLEEGDDGPVQLRHVVGTAGAHHDAVRV